MIESVSWINEWIVCELCELIHSKIWNIWNIAHKYLRCLLRWSPAFWKRKLWLYWDYRVLFVFLSDPMFVSENPVLKWNDMWANGLWADTAAGALGICGLGCGFRRRDCSKQERQVAYGTGSSYCVVAVWLWTVPLINSSVSHFVSCTLL